MNAREDKMNNSLGLQIGKTSLNYCVPVLFRVTGRARRKNILRESGWHSLTSTNTISLVHFVEFKQETHNPSKNVAYL